MGGRDGELEREGWEGGTGSESDKDGRDGEREGWEGGTGS